jgi:FtsZ-binding cell division protein ZapB
MEQDAFDVLEQKVRKAADTVKRLRGENEGLDKERGKLRSHVQELEKRVAALEKESEKKGAGAEQLEALGEEVKGLRGERLEIRKRIARLVEVLDGLE